MLAAQLVDNTNIHNRLILAVVNKLLADGYKVSANHIGYPNGKPKEYNSYTPDIFAEKNEKKIIFEAESKNSLNTIEIRSKWTTLLEYAIKENAKLIIIVPLDSLEKGKKLAKEWNIQIAEFWTVEI